MFESENARKREAFLARSAVELSSNLNEAMLLGRATRLAIPYLGDWCFLDLLDVDGRLTRSGLTFRYPEDENSAMALEPIASYFELFLWEVLRFGKPVRRDAGSLPEVFKRLTSVSASALMSVPLRFAGRDLGVLTLVMSRSGRDFGPEHGIVTEEFAHRISSALANARLLRETRQSVRQREEFAFTAAHELRTPLTVLKLQVSLLNRLASKSEAHMVPVDAIKQIGTMLEGSVNKFEFLLNRLFDVSSMRNEGLILAPRHVCLSELIEETVRDLSPLLCSSGCEVRLSLDASLCGKWDPFRLQQVVSNLIANAIKYAPGKRIDIQACWTGEKVRITVLDHGDGISPGKLSRIFECFERGEGRERTQGLGLGLYIVRQIVSAHGGKVWAENKAGAGALFAVELPRESFAC